MADNQTPAPQTQALTPFQSRAMELREHISSAEPTAIVPRTFAEAQAFASALATSDLVPQALRDNAPNVLMMILAGAEIHVPPIASMRVFHVMDGVPKLSADGIAATCMRHPSCEYLEPSEMSATKVTWIAKKKGRPEKTLTITREDMVTAGLYDRKNRDGSPGNHIKYPRQMLNARCKAELCRLVWPDICAGMISSEEIADELGLDAYAKANAIDVSATERKAGGFVALPTNTNEPAPKTEVVEPAAQPSAASESKPAVEPAAPPPPANAPLSDDDVAAIADDMRFAGDNKDVKALSAIAADIAKKNINEAQRKYLLGIYQKCSAAAKGAKP